MNNCIMPITSLVKSFQVHIFLPTEAPTATMALRTSSIRGKDGSDNDEEYDAFVIDPSLKPRSKLKIGLISIIDEIEDLWEKLQVYPSKLKRSVQQFQHAPSLLYGTLIISFIALITQGKSSNRELSTSDSLGLIQTTNEEWERMKSSYASLERHKHNKDEFIDDPNVWYQYNYPVEFICPNARKVGKASDGTDASTYLGDGKWVCNPKGIVDVVNKRTKRTSFEWIMERFGRQYADKNGCIIYSIGINANHLEFETNLQRILTQEASKTRGHRKGDLFCEIHVFDPAGYDEQLLIGDGIQYHNWGIVSSAKAISENDEVNENGNHFKTFQETLKELGHQGNIIDVMKVDCKMCEWGIYDDWFDHDDPNSGSDEKNVGLSMVQQLLVELHGTPEEYVNDFFESMRNENYVIFHKDSDTQTFQGMAQDYAFLKLDDAFFKN